jgi:GNAT superfamily N-acetyltransferase
MSGTIYIREAVVKDAAQITVLSFQLGYTLTAEATMANIAAIENSISDVAYVAVLDEQVVGWIHIFSALRLETTPFCEIGGLVVAEVLRGKGIGRLLVEQAKTWAATKHTSKLRVRCNVKRTDTHAFYSGIGFAEKKEQKVFEYSL